MPKKDLAEKPSADLEKKDKPAVDKPKKPREPLHYEGNRWNSLVLLLLTIGICAVLSFTSNH